MDVYVYKVHLWDSFDEKKVERCGVTFAGSYTEAMGHLEKFYQPGLISVELLCELDISHTLELPKNIMEAILKDELYKML